MASSNGASNPVFNETDESPKDRSAESSKPGSREGSRPPRKKHNVRFTPGGESLDTANQRMAFDIRDDSNAPPKPKPLPRRGSGTFRRNNSGASSFRRSRKERSEDIADQTARAPVPKARPSIKRIPSSDLVLRESPSHNSGKEKQKEGEVAKSDQGENEEDDEEDEEAPAKAYSQRSAQDRAERLSRMVGTHSAPTSRYSSPHRPRKTVVRSPPPSPPLEGHDDMPIDLNDLPLEKLETKRTKYGIEDDSDEEEVEDGEGKPAKKKQRTSNILRAAARLVGHHGSETMSKQSDVGPESPEPRSGAQTPVHERDPDTYVPRPHEYREGYLSSLLKLYDQEGLGSAISHIPSGPAGAARAARRSSSVLPLLSSASPDGPPDTPVQTPTTTPGGSPTSSGTTTPRQKHQKWYYKTPGSQSTGALSDLVSSSTVLAQPGGSKQSSVVRPKPKHRPLSHQAMDTVLGKKRRAKPDDAIYIQIHIAETMQRHEYLLRMCRALMSYGAPTHRLEEYMRMSARALQIEGQFLYIPGCMIVSFDDKSTHTTEVKIVRTSQGVNLGKLRDTHDIYKEVIHDVIGAEDAIQRLDVVTHKPNKYNPWVIVFVYGLTSVCVGPFAFGARAIDLPISFVLGCLLGFFQHIVAPKSDLYTNVFEVCASILTSFLARAFGSIHGGNIFCFSALAQSSIALILPGYTVLCGSLELQSRNIVAGSVRMIYAIIYSLFLGFGITVGTSVYGGMDKNATSDTSCKTSTSMWWRFIFVPPFTLCLIIINQGRWRQTPVMITIAFIGYVVNYYSAIRFASNTQIANTLGAFAIGVLGNVYSRWCHGLAAAALLPAIYVQVPSGLAASGSLVSGITSANQITNHTTGDVLANGTTTVSSAMNSDANVNTMVFNVGYSMIQVAIGITVGLFMSALFIYPFGKRRSGLFSF